VVGEAYEPYSEGAPSPPTRRAWDVLVTLRRDDGDDFLCRIELGTLGLTRRSHKLRCGVKRLYKSAVYGYFKPKK
jgi:hypothetical protein